MLVVIPTFKRTKCVKLVLESLMRCDLPPATEECRVAVVNNFPPNRAEIDRIVSEVRVSYPQSGRWKLITIHREKTIPLIENWYGAINALAKENEIFVLQGDDDLFTKSSLLARYNAFLIHSADVVLTHTFSGLTFLEGENAIHYPGSVPIKDIGTGEIVGVDFRNMEDFGPVFIGSQSYRYNQRFRDALECVGKWTSELLWIDYHHRTIMYAYYLVIASIHLRAKVVGLNSYCCIRGTSLQEKLQTPYNSSREANSGFLSLVMLQVFQNADLKSSQHDLKTTIYQSTKDARNWLFTSYIDQRVDRSVLKLLLEKQPLKLNFGDILFNLKVILKQHLGLKYIRLRLELWRGKRTYFSDEFIKLIQ